MSPAKKPPLPRLPCIGHQRESKGRVIRRSHGNQRWRRKCNRWERPEAAFHSWRRTGRSGGIRLLPYTPPGVIGMSELACKQDPKWGIGRRQKSNTERGEKERERACGHSFDAAVPPSLYLTFE